MKINGIDGGTSFDFGKTASAYAEYRDIYPKELYDRLRCLGVGANGTAWLDLGTGTGVLPKNLYNENCEITGADISAEQIAFARKEAAESGKRIYYITASAENTGLESNQFICSYIERESLRILLNLQTLVISVGVVVP